MFNSAKYHQLESVANVISPRAGAERQPHPMLETGKSLSRAARALEKEGRYEDALQRYREAQQAFQRAGDLQQLAVAEADSGLCLEEMGHGDEALRVYKRAEKLMRREMDPNSRELARLLDNIGCLLVTRGEYAEALNYETDALAVIRAADGEGSDYAAVVETIQHICTLQGIF